MPITLPNDLPAFDILSNEGVMVMSPGRAATQDIRPLRIALLNLMPKKIQTENQFARLIGAQTADLNGVCGHFAFLCDQESLKKRLDAFLAQETGVSPAAAENNKK